MIPKITFAGCFVAAIVTQLASAAPSFIVEPIGATPSGNRLWSFQVQPDFDLTPPVGTPLGIELAFAVDHTDLVDVTVNTSVWDTELPGHNPFTNTVTEGLWLDLIGERTYGAFGSMIVSGPGPVDLFLVETAGLGLTTMRYGVAASGHPSHGALIAQLTGVSDSVNFIGHTGTITVPEPATIALLIAVFALPAFRRSR